MEPQNCRSQKSSNYLMTNCSKSIKRQKRINSIVLSHACLSHACLCFFRGGQAVCSVRLPCSLPGLTLYNNNTHADTAWAPSPGLTILGSQFRTHGPGLTCLDSRPWAHVPGLTILGSQFRTHGSGLTALGSRAWAPSPGLTCLGSRAWAHSSGLTALGSRPWAHGPGLTCLGSPGGVGGLSRWMVGIVLRARTT